MVGATPSKAGDAGSVPGQGAGIPHASAKKKTPKTQHRSSIVANSLKTLKNNGPH